MMQSPRHRRRRPPARVHANLTPLIDVTFLLIVFFVLVSQITNSQIVDEIDLPEPEHAVSDAPEAGEDARLTINIIPQAENKREVAAYRLGSRDYASTPAGLASIASNLLDARQSNPRLILDLRADRVAPYSAVFPILSIARQSGISQINLLVQASDEGMLPSERP